MMSFMQFKKLSNNSKPIKYPILKITTRGLFTRQKEISCGLHTSSLEVKNFLGIFVRDVEFVHKG